MQPLGRSTINNVIHRDDIFNGETPRVCEMHIIRLFGADKVLFLYVMNGSLEFHPLASNQRQARIRIDTAPLCRLYHLGLRVTVGLLLP
jgi:hypothetical protein